MPGNGSNCYATIDWLIVGHAIAKQCVLVTNDTGVEFDGLTERVRLETLEGAIQKLLDQSA